jgi:hypothetical protein
MRGRKERRAQNLMRRYVNARHECEECAADRDWYGVEYALELVDFLFSRMEAEVSKANLKQPARRPEANNDTLMNALGTDELIQILDFISGACNLDGFGAVRDVNNGDMTEALLMYKSYKQSRNKQ